MFTIYDGRNKFYQWDKDRKLIVEDKTIKEVHFANCLCTDARVCEVREGLVDVPNELLTQDMDIRVWGYDGKMTKYEAVYEVERRTKPADYVYTPSEVWTAEKAVEDALTAAKESGDFNGADGKPGIPGELPILYMKNGFGNNNTFLYGTRYKSYDTEPDTTAIEITDNTKAEFLPEGYPAILTPGTGEYEGMLYYSVNEAHLPAGMMRRRLNINVRRNIDKGVMRFKIKVLSCKLASGLTVKPIFMMCDKYDANNGVFGADSAVADENGNILGGPFIEGYDGLKLNTWYTIYTTLNGNTNFMFWPQWKDIDDGLTMDAVIKDVELLHHETMPAYLKTNSGNCAPMSLYIAEDGTWQYSYSSFYEGTYAVPNTAWYRRMELKLDAPDYEEVRMEVLFKKSQYRSDTTINMATTDSNIYILSDPTSTTTIPANFRELNTWYTIVLEKSGLPLPQTITLYPQGYTDGTVNGMCEIEMIVKNVRGYKRVGV